MNTPERMARLFDAKAEEFDAIYTGRKGPLGRAWDTLTRANIQTRFDFTMRALDPVQGKRILDVGCGPGRYCIELAGRGAAQAVGLDVSANMLEVGRRLARDAGVEDRCRFVQGDVAAFAAQAASGKGGVDAAPFDAVLAMGFFDYILDQAEVMRCLRSICSGIIVASFPCRWALRVPARKLWWKLKGWDIRLSTRRSILTVCEQAGVSVIDLHREGPLYLLVASAGPAAPRA